MRILPVLLCIISLFIASETKARQRNDPKDTFMLSEHNIVYKLTPGGDSLLLDMFSSTKPKVNPRPVLIIIHGGAWVLGDRKVEAYDFARKLRDTLVKKDMVVVSIQYTLLKEDRHFPSPIADCQDAIRWVHKNAAKYNIDTSRIGLWGASAGGHLSLLAANTHELAFAGNDDLAENSTNVHYVIDNFGPTDMTAMLQLRASKFKVWLAKLFIPKALKLRNNLIRGIFATTLKDDKEKVLSLAKQYSPVNYLSPSFKPTLILHGSKDKLVPYKQSRELHKALDKNKVVNKLVRVNKGNHGFTNISEEYTDELVGEIVTFINERNSTVEQ
ncbi:MAG: alpha/beta hydrolase [Flavitalea sp.]